MKRMSWIILSAIAVGFVAFGYWFEMSSFGWKGGSELAFQEGHNPDWPIRDLDPMHVQQELPELHALLENAYRDGFASTRDRSLIHEIQAYIEEVTGSIEPNDNIRYREKIFRMLHSVQ